MRRLLFTILVFCFLSAGAFAQTPGSSGGLVVFETLTSTLSTNPSRANVLASPMTTQSLMFASSSVRLSRNFAIAIANPGSKAAVVTLTLRRGTDGVATATKVLTVGATQQSSIFLNEFYTGLSSPLVDFDGMLSVASDNPVAITAFRFRGDNFTTTPVTTLSFPTTVPQISSAVGGPDAVIVPHFATGNSWSSQIIISNTNAAPMTVRIDLFQQDGTAFTTTMNGLSGSSFLNIVVPARGIVTQSTDANGALRTGYAIVTPVVAGVPPTVLSTIPSAGAVDVPINQKLSASFSKSMDPSTIIAANFKLAGPGVTPVLGSVAYDAVNNIATFTPSSNLAINTAFIATVTTAVKDQSGTAMVSNFTWNFTTGTTISLTSPTVTSVDPANLATGVSISKVPSATFSKAMDPLTITSATFALQGPGTTAVAGTVGYSGSSNTATFTPTSSLVASTLYTATVTTGAKDLLGNALASNFVWSFTTAGVHTGPLNVDLAAAGPYGVLGGSGVTNSGPTTINGSLGTSPTGTLTGSPVVTGSTDLANPAAAAAKLALTAAFNDAAARSLNAISLPGDLSGLTLAPGLYSNSTSVILSAGNVTLDAQGDSTATWVFQVGSTLTTIAGTQVVLAGGAKAANIFWEVGSSATLGTNSIFKGNILASISISANTGAVIEGRLLTQTGAVSLLSNTVTVPTP